MRVAIAILLILGLTTLLLFVSINSSERVKVNLFYLKPPQEYPVSLVVLVAGMLGVFLASIIGIVEGTRLRLQNHQLRTRVRRLEAELSHREAPAGTGKPREEELDEEMVL